MKFLGCHQCICFPIVEDGFYISLTPEKDALEGTATLIGPNMMPVKVCVGLFCCDHPLFSVLSPSYIVPSELVKFMCGSI